MTFLTTWSLRWMLVRLGWASPAASTWFMQEAVATTPPVTVADLTLFAGTFVDLGDAEIMKGAWE